MWRTGYWEQGSEMKEEDERKEWGQGTTGGILDLGPAFRHGVQAQPTVPPGSSGLKDSKGRSRHREEANTL